LLGEHVGSPPAPAAAAAKGSSPAAAASGAAGPKLPQPSSMEGGHGGRETGMVGTGVRSHQMSGRRHKGSLPAAAGRRREGSPPAAAATKGSLSAAAVSRLQQPPLSL